MSTLLVYKGTMHSFIEVIDGYKYRLIEDVRCDGNICTATFEVEKDGNEIKNIEEIHRYIPVLITSVMENAFKEKYIVYDQDGSLYHMQNNVYELNWSINIKKDTYKVLKKYCEGKEVIILSGKFKNKKGIYKVEKKNIIINRMIDSVQVEGQKINLKNIEFKFIEDHAQMIYKEVK